MYRNKYSNLIYHNLCDSFYSFDLTFLSHLFSLSNADIHLIQVQGLVQIFRGRVVDVAEDSLTIEVSA